MNDLVVKEVNFLGVDLLAVKDVESGKIYAGINAILKDMGFDEKQIEYRRDKWVTDKSISKGTLKFSGTLIGAKTGKDVWCIDIKKIPLALAKLEITPKLERELPELSDKIETYQDACADVLAEAFLQAKEPVKKLTNEQIMRIQLGMMDEQGERLEDVEQRVDKLETSMTVDYEQQQRLKELAKTIVINAVGGKKARAYTYQYPQRDENDKPPKMYGMVISRLWHDYQDYFEVNSYRNTQKVKYEEALRYINAWQPTTNMQLDIGKINRGEI